MKYGDPMKGSTEVGAPKIFIERAINYIGDECLIWPFARNKDGYGTIHYGKKTLGAHVVVCKIVNGESENKKEVAHSCGNGHLGCVSPKHLRWATRKENCDDRVIHGTDFRGEKSGRAKLSNEDVVEIRRLGNSLLQREIAEIYSVSRSNIGNILVGRTLA
jgi:hypothetical protein